MEVYPGENIPPEVRTEVFIAFDRENMYIAFRGFDPVAVSQLKGSDKDALLVDTRIIRNRRKIEAMMTALGRALRRAARDGF